MLENDTSRQELIDQLRKVAATPPQDPVPAIAPPEAEEEKTVLENVTDISRRYGEALSSRFAQLYRNLVGTSHKPLILTPFRRRHPVCYSGWCRLHFLLAVAPVCLAALPENGTVGTQKESA